MSKKSNENKESVVRDIFEIVCASAMIPFAIALACKGGIRMRIARANFSKTNADGED